MKTKTLIQNIILKNKVDSTGVLSRLITVNSDLTITKSEFFEKGVSSFNSLYVNRLFNEKLYEGQQVDMQWFEEVPNIFKGESLKDINTFEVVNIELKAF